MSPRANSAMNHASRGFAVSIYLSAPRSVMITPARVPYAGRQAVQGGANQALLPEPTGNPRTMISVFRGGETLSETLFRRCCG